MTNLLLFIFIVIIVTLILGLGIIVYLGGRRKRINQIFLLITICAVIWIIGVISLFSLHKFPKKQALLIGRIPFFAAISLLGLLFYFVQIFPKKIFLFPNFLTNLFVFLSVSILSYISLFTGLILKDIKFENTFPIAIFGPFFLFFSLFFIGLSFSTILLLALKYKKVKGIEKMQILYFLIGLILSLIFATFTNLILPQIVPHIRLYQFGPFGLTFFIVFTTLAITRYHLFGIEVILTEILVGLIGILLILQIFIAPNNFWKVANGIAFLLFCIGGWLLIKYTFREIKRREEMERLSQAKTEFLSIASHQLRTPLSIIKGYLSMLLEGSYGKLPENTKKPMENVAYSTERLIKLVNDLLSATRIETGKMEMSLAKVNLEELIESVVKEMEIKAKEKNLYLKFEKPKEKIPLLTLDREKIRQVILNLIDNGIRYTHSGGVSVSLKKINNFVKIKIKDTGEGLTKEEKEKLFESFSRGIAGTKFYGEGAGLGLYIAKKVVELHKGKIWAESEGPGRGSTFFVQLPIK